MSANVALRTALVPTVRHEFGHWVTARVLEFPTGAIFVKQQQAGSTIEIVPSVKTLEDAASFCERRIQILYAGSLAESLSLKNKIQNDAAHTYLKSTATNDFAKVRELARLLTGIKHPGVLYSDFEKRLKDIDQRLYERAAKRVQKFAALIADLSVFYVNRYEQAWTEDTKKTENHFELSAAEIEQFPNLQQRFVDG